jgi:hypothetical protein
MESTIKDTVKDRSVLKREWYQFGYRDGQQETVEEVLQLLEGMRVPEDGRHEWRDHHNDTLDRCKARIISKFKIKED